MTINRVELTICVYRHLPTFLSSFSYVPDLLCWVGYLCLSSFTNLFVKFFVCTRFTPGWVDYLCLSSFTNLFVKFFVCTRLTGLSWLFVFIVIYRPFCQVFRMYQTYCWVDYLCLSLFTNLFVKFLVCTRLTALSWLFVFMGHLPIFLSSFFVCTRLTQIVNSTQ